MAEETPDGQEKTEEPTEKRRRDAKEKGQVPRSRELSTTLAMLAAAVGLLGLGGYMADGLDALLRGNLAVDRAAAFDPNAPVRMFEEAIIQGILVVAPFALIMLAVNLVAPVALGGWSFSGKALAPKLEKISPLKGFKRIFGVNGLVELGKALAKITVVGTVGVVMLKVQLRDFQALTGMPLAAGAAQAADLFFGTFLVLSVSLILIAAVDIPYQIWDHTKKLRMTKQEVKDEFKDTEGKPEVKGRIRQLQQELARGRMMEAVPEADVVVTNPTHFAVALRYDGANMRAPRVVAKGGDQLARRIRELAGEHRVPLFEAPQLARALYHTTDIDDEIPAGLYLAVAQVLAYIFRLRRGTAGGPPPAPEVPEEFRQYARRGAAQE
ncbi:Flagellar biosynthetic protein FlhB [wastewater metagenome]|uniref:Flagellar biosynthetic protein FlhB n=2 Tax=unclassified sequences TaxID=12908 RepID=A0A5B8R791_9ZZZZ|nr:MULTISPECIES: flagellar biosynthesis protein FlhB [Arhodomonas]MCS4502784.1 flagellar biosynthesis protein FlhB [Arhodomonas aquaeolei]QEA03733.1 flagellar biosynthetic protein FlhB [uncultured organism]